MTRTLISLLLAGASLVVAGTLPVQSQQPPADGGLSELDALSQNSDDPFANLAAEKVREPISVTVRGLNKITAVTRDMEIPIDSVQEFGTLEIVARFCDKRPPEDFPETTAFLQVFDKGYSKSDPEDEAGTEDGAGTEDKAGTDETPEAVSDPSPIASADPTVLATPIAGPKTQGDRVFSGWMFASSPGLNGLEHSVYDVWVIDCKTRLVDNETE